MTTRKSILSRGSYKLEMRSTSAWTLSLVSSVYSQIFIKAIPANCSLRTDSPEIVSLLQNPTQELPSLNILFNSSESNAGMALINICEYTDET